MQSRKIIFVEVGEENQARYDDALAGHEVLFADRLEDVPADAEVLSVSVFMKERVDRDFLDAHSCLRLIATRSTAYDYIDIEACRARNVAVTNVGSYGENTVAEHTFALILALSRRLKDSEEAVRTGHFSRALLRGFDLRGKTLGVVGTGRVGLHVIRIGAGFGMRVIACDVNPESFPGDLLNFRFASFEELMREAHIVSLHVPLTADTHHMINRESLALCRPGTLLINTARGGLIDTDAAVEALDAGRLGGLGLDVLEDERVFQSGGATPILGEKIARRVHETSSGPVGHDFFPARVAEFSRLVTHSRLMQRRDVMLTPHVAFNSAETVDRLHALTLQSILEYLEGKPLTALCT